MSVTKADLNKRVLYRRQGEHEVREGVIRDFSPSGKYAAVDYSDIWLAADQVNVIEELPEVKYPAPTAVASSSTDSSDDSKGVALPNAGDPAKN